MRYPLKHIDRRELKKHVHYDPATGKFTLRIATARLPVGHVFSTRYPNEYIQIKVNGKTFRANRAAWVYMTGEQPVEVDHLNWVKHDNRWLNLTNGSHSDNMKNRRPRR